MLDFAVNMKNQGTSQERNEKVFELIKELNLNNCMNTKVGNFNSRGLSGGEKRRLSLAEQVVYEPTIIFLDEATSGLDSFNALLVVSLLKKLAK